MHHPDDRRSPSISAREVAIAALLGVCLAVAMTWPLPLHLGSDIGKDLGDPLFQSWQIAWIGHALLHEPLDLFQANIYWPEADTLAFSDVLLGYAPAGLVAQRDPHAALVVYNVLFIFAYALAFVGAALLARELGAGRGGAIAAGAAFAYAPWKLAQNGHLHVISNGGIPLALFLLVRGYRSGSTKLVAFGWLTATWQLTLGFTLGLQLACLLAVLAVVVLVRVVRNRARGPSRALVAATAAGIAVFATAGFLQARPYLRVVDTHPEARRTPSLVASFSPAVQSFLAAPEQSLVWGDVSSRVRRPFAHPDEMTLFPGLAISALALAGLLGGVYPRRLRLGLAVGVGVCALLSLGPRDTSGPLRYLSPYRVLFDFVPGWDGIRTPGRINTLTSLGLALLAGAGFCVVTRLVARFTRPRRPRLRRTLPVVAGILLVAAVLADGLGPLEHPRVPPVPTAQQYAAAPRLHLPWNMDNDTRYAYWSIAGFRPIVNGVGGFVPTSTEWFHDIVGRFPGAASVAALRSRGVRTVLVHTGLVQGTPWESIGRRPVAGLPLERRVVGDVVLFTIPRSEQIS